MFRIVKGIEARFITKIGINIEIYHNAREKEINFPFSYSFYKNKSMYLPFIFEGSCVKII